jgi:hypothetical protein
VPSGSCEYRILLGQALGVIDIVKRALYDRTSIHEGHIMFKMG